MRSALALPLLALACASRAPAIPETPPWPRATDAAVPRDVAADVPADATAAPEPLRGVTALRVAWETSCALRDDGVWCWRGDDHTAHAPGRVDDQFTVPEGAARVPELTEVTDLCVATDHLCALRRDGALRCRGIFRADPMSSQEEFDPQVVAWDFPRAQGVVAVEGDGTGCFARRRDGGAARVSLPERPECDWTLVPAEPARGCVVRDEVARCWGDNARGLLENSTARAFTHRAPTSLFGLRGVRAVALGDRHGCAAMGDGTLRCWGRNLEGQLGTGDRRSRAVPTVVPGIDGVSAVAVGRFFTCALRAAGDVRCWGINRDGELGDGSSEDHITPTPVADLTDAAELAVADRASCVRTRSGEVWCWGPGGHTRGREERSLRPRPVMTDAP